MFLASAKSSTCTSISLFKYQAKYSHVCMHAYSKNAFDQIWTVEKSLSASYMH